MSEKRRIYKYLGASGGIKTLQPGLLKFSPPSEFNDPFEMQPFLVNVASEAHMEKELTEKFESWTKEGYGKLPQPVREVVTLAQYRNIAVARQPELLMALKQVSVSIAPAMRREFVATINSTIGVYCMSEAHDSLLMWAHYADMHRGLVIEFNREHAFFSRKRGPNDEFNQLLPVFYSQARPKDYLVNMDVTSVFLTKSEDWSYEREWRILSPLSDRTEHRDGMHLFEFPPECVTGVILGCKISKPDEKTLLDLLGADGRYKHVVRQKARLDESEFRLHFDPI